MITIIQIILIEIITANFVITISDFKRCLKINYLKVSAHNSNFSIVIATNETVDGRNILCNLVFKIDHPQDTNLVDFQHC